jgi:ABC-type transporter Mla MlaB component
LVLLERPLPLIAVERGEQEMLKITQQRDAASETMSLILEGRLVGPWVKELHSCWRQMAVSQQGRTVIELTGVTFVDAEGKALLTQMWQQGAQLHAVGCLTRCIVEEITKTGRTDSSSSSRKAKMKGS